MGVMKKGYGQTPDIVMQGQEIIDSLVVESGRERSAHQTLHSHTSDGTWSQWIRGYLGPEIFRIGE